ncbi:unnamed protein product [Blepharisma stoltei]|uniref:U3 small nucleolar RNA-associated protein 11 n=1 Tax=Blepharisma stoltei TaxID=1481888 RepID=A0AAU9K0H6_9CILI|nr:unnamed protein product [Blepharisma stoltei]
MSTWKNAIPKRKYRERSQPSRRKHLGMLEKHQDYKLRAKDYHEKEDKLNILRDKAYFRNPDEFYFKMIKSGFHNGKHLQDEEEDEPELLKKQKTQDSNLMNMKVQAKQSTHEQLKSQLHLVDAEKPNTHMIFVKTSEEAKALQPAEYFNTDSALLDRKGNRLTKEQLESMEIPEINNDNEEGYNKFNTILEEEEILKDKLHKIEKKKELMKKGKRKLVDEDGQVYKWFWERKR